MTNPNTTTTATETLSNTAAMRKELSAKITTLGAADAKGSASRPEAALRLVAAAHDDLIGESFAAEAHAAYVMGQSQAAGRNPLAAAPNSDSEKVQVSKFRTFIKVGLLPDVDATDIMRRAAETLKSLDATDAKTYSRFDGLLNVAREQLKQPTEPLTDEQIAACVTKPEAVEKDAVARLIAAYKAAVSLAEKVKMPETEEAVDSYARAIKEAGGELPPRTKKEKDMAKFMAQASALGFQIV